MTVRSRVLDEDENDGRKQEDGGAVRVYISAGESLGRKKRTEGTRIAYSSRDTRAQSTTSTSERRDLLQLEWKMTSEQNY